MNDQEKTKEQLIAELNDARKRIADMEATEDIRGEMDDYFQTTMAYSPVSMQIYTLDGILRNYNRAFEELFGVDGPSVVNRYNVFEDEKVKEMGAIPFLERTRKGESFHNYINEYDAAIGFKVETGRQRWLRSSFFPIKDKNGQVRHFMIMHEDITELKQHELHMEDLVKEQTALLESQNRELVRLANVDGLTQISNRRYFDITLQEEWQRLSREQNYLSLIFIDLDLFKPYNDQYGHLAGDECLRKVAQALDAAVERPADFVARYGGEEFVALLPNTDEHGAQHLAGKIQKNIRQLNIHHKVSPISSRITCSMGISCTIPSQDISMKKFVASADEAMYRAKGQGRNQFVVAKSRAEDTT